MLAAFGQPASYFNLQNRFWRLVGLDSAYVNHNFTAPQMTWLNAQISDGARTLLLTHHHLFSGFRKRGVRLEEWLEPYFAGGRLFGAGMKPTAVAALVRGFRAVFARSPPASGRRAAQSSTRHSVCSESM